MDEKKLKPCPFCQSDDVDAEFARGHKYVSSGCMNCGASGPDAETVDEAVKLWNTRSPEEGKDE